MALDHFPDAFLCARYISVPPKPLFLSEVKYIVCPSAVTETSPEPKVFGK